MSYSRKFSSKPVRPPCVSCAKFLENCPRPADGAISMKQLLECAEYAARSTGTFDTLPPQPITADAEGPYVDSRFDVLPGQGTADTDFEPW